MRAFALCGGEIEQHVARRIAEAHGGTITCEREPGFGATFVLKLPRRAPAALAETEVATTQLMRT